MSHIFDHVPWCKQIDYNKQFGFCSNHSTSHAFIKEKLDSGSHVGGIFIDLEKAFNTVSRNLLVEKLYILMDLKELVNNL